LSTVNPEVLMLMEGTNDLNNGASNIPEALESLEDMINIARQRGVTSIFLATIAPIAPGGPSSSTIPLVFPFNSEIRNLAARKGVTLVDVYSALNADLPRYYAGDDLHPLAEGHRVIGETFYESIRTTLDITPRGVALSPASTPGSLFDSPGRQSPGLKTRPPKTSPLPPKTPLSSEAGSLDPADLRSIKKPIR
jgi:hypothetical protein